MSKIFHKIASKLHGHKDSSSPHYTGGHTEHVQEADTSSYNRTAERDDPQLTSKIGELSVHDDADRVEPPAAIEETTEPSRHGSTTVSTSEDYGERARDEINRDEALERQQVEERLTQDQTYREEPVVKERVHHHYTHVDKTQVEKIIDKTEIRTIIQPIVEEKHVEADWKAVDDGVTVREYGAGDLSTATIDKLRARHEEAQLQGGREEFETHTHVTDERHDVTIRERTRVVEQVLPVIERVIYVPQRAARLEEESGHVHTEQVLHDTTMNAPSTTVGSSSSNYTTGWGEKIIAPVVEEEWTKRQTCDDVTHDVTHTPYDETTATEETRTTTEPTEQTAL